MWSNYTEYLLGDECYFFSMDQEGCSTKASWMTVLGYDFAMRKAMTRSVMYDNLDTLELAKINGQLRERYFTTPTAMLAAAGKGETRLPDLLQANGEPIKVSKRALKKKRLQEKEEKAGKGASKEEKAGKAAGKGKERKENPFAGLKTQDGRLICGYYNTPGGCKKTGCKFLHACSKCWANHPAAGCPLP